MLLLCGGSTLKVPAPLCHLHMADVVEIAAQLLLKHSPAEVGGCMFCVASAVSICSDSHADHLCMHA